MAAAQMLEEGEKERRAEGAGGEEGERAGAQEGEKEVMCAEAITECMEAHPASTRGFRLRILMTSIGAWARSPLKALFLRPCRRHSHLYTPRIPCLPTCRGHALHNTPPNPRFPHPQSHAPPNTRLPPTRHLDLTPPSTPHPLDGKKLQPRLFRGT